MALPPPPKPHRPMAGAGRCSRGWACRWRAPTRPATKTPPRASAAASTSFPPAQRRRATLRLAKAEPAGDVRRYWQSGRWRVSKSTHAGESGWSLAEGQHSCARRNCCAQHTIGASARIGFMIGSMPDGSSGLDFVDFKAHRGTLAVPDRPFARNACQTAALAFTLRRKHRPFADLHLVVDSASAYASSRHSRPLTNAKDYAEIT